MLKIFISSHGHLASGMKSSIEILTGPNPKITVFDAYVDQENVQDKLDEFYKNVADDDQVILLSDLYGGSVNQVMSLYCDRPNTTLIAGVNLALALELAVKEEVGEKELEELVETSRQMLRIVKLDKVETPSTEDEFF